MSNMVDCRLPTGKVILDVPNLQPLPGSHLYFYIFAASITLYPCYPFVPPSVTVTVTLFPRFLLFK
jgi:hypothetical protein